MNQVFGGFVTVVLLLSYGPAVGGAPPCVFVIQELSPCLPYLVGSETSLPQDCCNGIKYVAQFSQTKQDRTAVCQCIVSVANALGGIHTSLIPPLPAQCGLQITLPSPSYDMDCSKV